MILVTGVVLENNAQLSAVPKSIRAMNILERINYLTPSDLLYGIPMPEKRLVGDVYLTPEWKRGSIMLYSTDNLVEGFPMRLDLFKDELEIKTKSGIKVIEGKKIKSFVWVDSSSVMPQYFINGREYRNQENVAFDGFFQVLVDGSFPLFSYMEVLVKRSNYNMALNVGEKDDRIIKKQQLYYVKDGTVLPLPTSRKKLLPVFGDRSSDVEKFIRVNFLSVNDERHLKSIFEYYNSLD